MCLGVIGTVRRRWEEDGVPMAVIATESGEQTACLAFCPEAAAGNAVVTHSGFVVEVLDPVRAAEAQRLRSGLSQGSGEAGR